MAPAVEPVEPPSALPMARLRLAPRNAVSLRVDGAWWPRSHHLLAELPSLISALPPEWGKIVTVTVNTQMWAEAPGRILLLDEQTWTEGAPAITTADGPIGLAVRGQTVYVATTNGIAVYAPNSLTETTGN